jgi:DNA polymerase (family X)
MRDIDKDRNEAIAAVLRETAHLLEFDRENPFRARAYLHASREIARLEEDIGILIEEERLTEIEGIGDRIAAHITQLVVTGTFPLLETLKQGIPPGHRDLLRLPGLNPGRIKTLYHVLNVKNIDELEQACMEDRLIDLHGFGPRTQEKVLRGIHQVKKYQGCHLYSDASSEGELLLKQVLSHPQVIRASLAGSLRRRLEIVRNINLVLSTEDSETVISAVSRFPEVERRLSTGGASDAVYSLYSGMELQLHTVHDREFPIRLYSATGNLAHWKALCRKAAALGFQLNQRFLSRGSRELLCKEEQDLLDRLGLDFIPPELREDQGEIEAAEEHRLPGLISDVDLRGILHVHTSYSDGTASIATLAEAARNMGLSYIGIADHSQSATYAGGLSPDRLREQWDEIDRLNQELQGIHILKGIESDILPDGSLDYEDELLKKLDYVIASVHSQFKMSREEMTGRIITAMRNPRTTLLAHPTGRLLLSRDSYEVDMSAVIEEAARTGVVIELNAHPDRLEIDWRLCRYAKEKRVKIAINPDAHREQGLADISFGVGIARKGWLEPADILNTLSLDEIGQFLKGGGHGRRHS